LKEGRDVSLFLIGTAKINKNFNKAKKNLPEGRLYATAYLKPIRKGRCDLRNARCVMQGQHSALSSKR
jgi:hypothetical protein